MKNFTLSSGKNLSYSEFGDLTSERVIVYGHGFPGTGEEAGIAHKAATKMNFRILAPTRPGIGFSDFVEKRAVTDWPESVNELLCSLKIERFSLLGVSGGTPYALACLRHMPDRVDNCLIVSGVGPQESIEINSSMAIMSRVPLWCAKHIPKLGLVVISLIGIGAKISPEWLLKGYEFFMSSDDKRLLKTSKITRYMITNFQLALRQGSRGIRHDFALMTKDWGFRLSDLEYPITLFHGDQDNLVPISIAEKNTASLPHAELRRYKGRGHFMAFEITDEILEFFAEKYTAQSAGRQRDSSG